MSTENGTNLSEQPAPAPRVAIIVSDRAYRDISNDDHRAHLLEDPDSLVVPYSAAPVAQVERVSYLREHLIARDLMATDQLLVRNPYDIAAYEFADDAIETFVKAKYYHLASIAAYLGASSVKFVKVEIEHEKSDSSGSAKVDVKVAKVDAQFARSVKNRLEGRFEAATDLGGKPVDVEAARAFMIERRLSSDPDVLGLIDLSATGNPVRTHRVKINGLRESTRTFKAGLELTTRLDMKPGGGGLFTRAAESISSIEVTTEIVWPKG